MPVLVVGKKGNAELLTTRSAFPGDNRELIDWQVKLISTGAGIIQGTTKLWGAPATELREKLFYATSDEQKLWLETYLATRCSGAKLNTFQITGLYPVVDPLIVSYNFHTATFATPRMRKMVFRPAEISAFDLPNYFRSANRKHPIRFRYGSKSDLNLIVNIPQHCIVTTPDWSDSVSSLYGVVTYSCSTIDSTYHASASYCINGESISPHDYNNFQDFVDTIREKDMHEVIVIQKEKDIFETN